MFDEYFCRSHAMSQRHDPQLIFSRNGMSIHIIDAQHAKEFIYSIITIFFRICCADDGHYRFQQFESNEYKNQFNFDNKTQIYSLLYVMHLSSCGWLKRLSNSATVVATCK